MVKKMSLIMVAFVAMIITLEMRSTIARVPPVGSPEVQQHEVAATNNDVAHQSIPVIAASKKAVFNPPMFPGQEAAPKDVVNPQDVNRAIPSGLRPQSAKEVIIPQRCPCCKWYYGPYLTYCIDICCV